MDFKVRRRTRDLPLRGLLPLPVLVLSVDVEYRMQCTSPGQKLSWHPQPNTCGAHDLAVPQLAQNLLSAAGNAVPHWKQNLLVGAAPSAAATVKEEEGWP